MTRERIAALPEDDWRKRSPNFQEPPLSRHLLVVERLRAAGQRYNATPGARSRGNCIIGVRNAQQARGIASVGDVRLGTGDVMEIEQALTRRAA